ncbi:MAG TPA: SAM-dependent chlorinase/fluorinase [Polyangiaceae bacterium]|nr:SAM-dependent chlorinase/fluorinase [Polyangiaceae bacterium]
MTPAWTPVATPSAASHPEQPRPCGVVSLLTDFGVREPFVGIMKAVMLRQVAGVQVIDLCHGVPPGSVEIAGFFLERSFGWFPEGTVHCCVVDPGVGSERNAIAVRARGHFFVAPDNGLLTPLLEAKGEPLVGAGAEFRRIDATRLGLALRSRTFHGRDVFAPVAAALASGQLAFSEVGESLAHLVPAPPTLPVARRDGACARGRVLAVDHYGNLITDLDGAWLEPRARVEVAGRSLRVVGTYSEAEPGEVVALVNSFEMVEIALRDGSAERALNVTTGAPTRILYGASGTRESEK